MDEQNTAAAPRNTEEQLVVPPVLLLRCGCTIYTDQLPCTDPDEATRKRAKASLICVIEQHIADRHNVPAHAEGRSEAEDR